MTDQSVRYLNMVQDWGLVKKTGGRANQRKGNDVDEKFLCGKRREPLMVTKKNKRRSWLGRGTLLIPEGGHRH
jgi:hypothetical protein